MYSLCEIFAHLLIEFLMKMIICHLNSIEPVLCHLYYDGYILELNSWYF